MQKKIGLFILAMILILSSACNDSSHKDLYSSKSNIEYNLTTNIYTETQVKNQIPDGYIIEKILAEKADGYYALCIKNIIHDTQHSDNEEMLFQNEILFIGDKDSKTVWTGNCVTAAMDSKSKLYILSEEVEGSAKQFILKKYNEQYSEYDALVLKAPPKEHSIFVDDIYIYSDRVVIVREGGLQIFDLSGKVLFEKSYKSINNSITDGKYLYLTEYPVLGGDTNRLFQFDIFNLREGWSTDVQLVQDQIKLLAYNSYKSKLYVVLNNRLMAYENGKLSEVCNLLDYKSGKLVSNARVSNDESRYNWYQQLLFQNKDEFSLLMFTTYSDQLFTYNISNKQATAQPRSAVNILLPIHDINLEMTAARFEEENTNVKIHFVYYKEKGDISQPDFIQFLNLKVLSGEQNWDMVPIIFLPYWQYIQKGVLADLDSLDEDHDLNNPDKYYVNLIDGCRINGKLYYLPTYITFPSFLLDITNDNADKLLQQSQIWTWTKLEQDIASWTKDSRPFKKDPMYSESAISAMIYSPYISGFFTGEKKQQDTELFEECLSLLSNFEAQDLYATGTKIGAMTPYLDTAWPNFRMNPISFFENTKVISVPVLEEDNKRSFYIQQAYAINSHSSNPSAAFDFLQYIVQDSSWGYPGAIVKADRNYIIRDLSSHLKTSPEKLTSFVDSLLAAKSALNHAHYFDQQVGGIVSGIIDQYRKGLISKEKAAKDIAQRVWLYANE